MAAYCAGNVTIVNAPGTGIADDKAVYSFMPEIVRYYMGEDALLPNVETFRCREPQALAYTLDNLEQLVVKLVDGRVAMECSSVRASKPNRDSAPH